MSVESTPEFQRRLLQNLLDLSQEMNTALDRLNEQVQAYKYHRDAPKTWQMAVMEETSHQEEQQTETHGKEEEPAALNAPPPRPDISEEEEIEVDDTLTRLAHQHATLMETLIQADLGQLPELLEPAIEVREEVRRLMTRLEESRYNALEVLSFHKKQSKGAAAYAQEASRMH